MSSPEEPLERDVLSSLPRTRPQRRSAKRDGGAKAGSAARAKPEAAAGARKTPAKPRKPAAARRKPTATPRKPTATPRKPTATPRKPTATARKRPAPQPRAATTEAQPPPQPESATPRSVEPPSRTDVLAGAADAAGELVKAGLAVGGELLRVALSRLPRP